MTKLTKEQFESLCFTHEGTSIHNPFFDESMRFEVDPQDHYGFTVCSTGGGCEAIVRGADQPKHNLMLTDGSGCNVPSEAFERPDDVLVALLNEDGDELICVRLSEIMEAADEYL